MRPFGEIVYLASGYVLRVGLLLLALTSLYICVMAFFRRRGPAYRIAVSAHEAFLMGLLVLLTDGTYFPSHLPARVSFPWAVGFVFALPWGVLAAVEIISFVFVAVCVWSEARLRRKRPSRDSIKEALDDLPVGVCFIAENGTVSLANLRMNEWCLSLTGHPLSDGNAFIREIDSAGEIRNGSILLRLSEECVLLFTGSDIEANGRRYRQLTAADMKEQFRVTSFLEGKNAKLRDISVRMKAYSVELTDLVMRRESLAARVAVHDGLGHALLRTRHYLENPEDDDAFALYSLLKQTNDHLLVASRAGDEPGRDPLEYAIWVANGVGVKVSVIGKPPIEKELLKLAGQAARECAMNAVKHAGGDALSIAFGETKTGYTVCLTSNGEPASGEITLTGGLRSLKDAVTAFGGSMAVKTLPAFTVNLRLPKKSSPSRPK